MAEHKKRARKIVFLTGTRADFGKLKPLMMCLDARPEFDVHIFATGMHLAKKYGETVIEIRKSGFKKIHSFDNGAHRGSAADTLAKTISGFSAYVRELKPDLIVVHGDRIEPLAGALVGGLNNIPVAHIEGGEVSGTIDEHLRHAISKLSHLHFVANETAKRRLIQMGEAARSIFVIGSPDLDLLASDTLPPLSEVTEYYEIPFENYGVVMFHPVTTEVHDLTRQTNALCDALLSSGRDYVVIYPNNDEGTDVILTIFKKRLFKNPHIRAIRSMRFEYFLTLIKNAACVVGNSSAGVREAPFYGVPSIDIGTRQQGRLEGKRVPSVTCLPADAPELQKHLKRHFSKTVRYRSTRHFGKGDSTKRFLAVIGRPTFWNIPVQKKFVDLG